MTINRINSLCYHCNFFPNFDGGKKYQQFASNFHVQRTNERRLTLVNVGECDPK